MLLCFRALMILCTERGVVIAVTVDKVGGMEERLLGGVENSDGVSSSVKSVKVDMVFEKATIDGAEPSKMLEPRLCSVNSVSVDTDEEAGGCSPLMGVKLLSKWDNVKEDAGEGKPYDPWRPLFLEGFVGVDCTLDADELQYVTEEHVDEGVGSPESKVCPNKS
jgi:hypothetical protein